MPAIDLNVVLAVLVAAIVVPVAVVGGWLRARRRRARPDFAHPRPPSQPDDPGVVLAPSTIRRGFSSPADADKDPLGRALDSLTGLPGPTDWTRLVSDEDARHARYRRPATVVVIELDGLERLVAALGSLAADRVTVAVAHTIRRHARRADHVARLGTNRFGVLLPETDEVAAINFVERVREAVDRWLEAGAMSLRLAIGWASPGAESSIVTAQTQAIERMLAEVRRHAPRARAPGNGLTDPAPSPERASSTV